MSTTLTLPPVSLEELNEHAAFQTRVDTKYLVPAKLAVDVAAQLPARSRVLQIGAEQHFAYQSVYFDTPDLLTYRMSAHRRRRRFKVRTRAYVQSGSAFLEVKIRGVRGNTEKVRVPHDPAELEQLSPADLAFIQDILRQAGIEDAPIGSLTPYLATGYQRTTYVTSATRTSPPVRTTVDGSLYWEQLRAGDLDPAVLYRPTLAIIETKSSSLANSVNWGLWQRGIRPTSFSKYCTGAAALDPRLPANKWHRQLKTLLKEQL